ncbi:MAG: ATP-dependent DNA helicase RecG, partial [Nocardioidaceae bacterium]|nr:ATP-dependent DNA helicase RecG [Nocardioidaceae bacterium]
MPGIRWDSKLATVAGKHADTIEKAFGYTTVGELLQHYPRRYVDRDKISEVDSLAVDDYLTVQARVSRARQHPYRDKRTGRQAWRLEVMLQTEGADLMLTFFDRSKHTADWRARVVAPGRIGLFSGKLGRWRNTWQLVNPQTKMMDDGEDTETALDDLPAMVPIYPATAGVQSWQLADAIATALDLVDEIPEPLPADVLQGRDLLPVRQALQWIHRPDSWSQKGAAERRLRFDEAFVTQAVLALRRSRVESLDTKPRAGRPDGLLDRFDQRLPFELTAGQREVGEDVAADLAAGHPMHRLLQGEVGSGKTLVALRAMLRVVDSGGQTALLAPTEVLAQQHFRSITAMLGDLAEGGMLGGDADATSVVLLTGSSSTAARREAMLPAASGEAGIVIGTHALLEDKVQFADLGLVVVDEQHRFGVEQRAALTSKAQESPPHVLVMTATPIPRTVAMTVFGDLETSTLAELPAGRAPIQTNVVALDEHPAWLTRAFERIREEVGKGHQVYVVCPRIGAGDTDNADDPDDPDDPDVPPADDGKRRTASVEEVAPMLADGPLEGLRVEALHGRLAPDRKDEVMRAFAAGDVDVLVSTTVIEVGVDVANATMMVILDADRFGVSQLHQLRGRVGRGGLPGLCLLVSAAPAATPARERLDAVAATTDGF